MKLKQATFSIACLASIFFLPPSIADTFVVTNTSDTGPGSFRDAIQEANTNGIANIINFNIPGAGPHRIQPMSALPIILETVDIDGYSEPGAERATATTNAKIKIVLDGSVGSVDIGLSVLGDNSRLRGLVVNNFSLYGLYLLGDNNILRGNYIGTNKKGTESRPNGTGVFVLGENSEIGGVLPEHKNVISGNDAVGIHLIHGYNIVHGNHIGLNASGTMGVGYSDKGVLIEGDENLIGGTEDGAGNIISGNLESIYITGNNNQVQGNIIGPDITGTRSNIVSGWGVTIVSGDYNEIGGSIPDARNIISNHGGSGIAIYSHDALYNSIEGNYIGTDISGSIALPNLYDGVYIDGDNTSVGGESEDSRNVISGNGRHGININSEFNVIQNNYIGTDSSGDYAIGNEDHGVDVNDQYNQIGGLQSVGNVISGNVGSGVKVLHSDNSIFGNKIGSDATGSHAIGNLEDGITVYAASNTLIGAGVSIYGSLGNVIAWNGRNGVSIITGERNAITRNSIFENTLLGIDLDDDGVTANDAGVGDGDIGANELQNYPEITNIVNGDGTEAGTITVDLTLDSTSLSDFLINFYSSANCDASGHGEGENYISSVAVSTNLFGVVSDSFILYVTLPYGHYITATASDLSAATEPFTAPTSEFSECAYVGMLVQQL